ncbi:MAG: hypothetical protein ACXVB0_24630 [Mucilaginibacter sp.]
MKPKLTHEQRRLASQDLTANYLSNYYAGWRYTKVLALHKMLQERHVFFSDIAAKTKSPADPDGEATIAQEIQHGLYFDAISQCVQYIEDLFALIKASKTPDYFVRNIITYKAGEVINYLKSFKAEDKNIGSIFHFPGDLKFPEEEKTALYETGKNNLVCYVNELIKFYKNYEFFHNQYKHGLAVAMRPFGHIYNPEQVKKDKAGDPHTYLTAYDNMNLQASFKKGTASTDQPIMMLAFTDNVRPYITQLIDENNFIRLVYPPDHPKLDFDLLIGIAQKAFCCINVFVDNYYGKLRPKGKGWQFELPMDHVQNRYILCSYE